MTRAAARGPVSGTPPRTTKRKAILRDLYSTALGKKYAMAITGISSTRRTR